MTELNFTEFYIEQWGTMKHSIGKFPLIDYKLKKKLCDIDQIDQFSFISLLNISGTLKA